MANMPYVRFVNTYENLVECFGAIQDSDEMKKLSKSEKRYMFLLADLAEEFARYVHEELTEED